MVKKKDQRTVVIATLPNEVEGALVVAQLKNAGIQAELIGALTSAWRVKVPGDVKVIVLEDDVEKAVQSLQQRPQESAD